MFQSIKYLNHTYDNKYKLYTYHYELVDSEFTPAHSSAEAVGSSPNCVKLASTLVATVKKYEKINTSHQDIIKNLFLMNIFLLKQDFVYKDISEILEYQLKYLIKEYYPETNFNEKYYDDLVKYTRKILTLT